MITLRPATQADLPAAVEVFWSCWTRSYPSFAEPEALARLTRAGAEELWAEAWPRNESRVAVDGTGRVVGLVRFAVTGSTTEVHSLYVDPDRQGDGIGGRLLEAAAGAGLVLGADDCALWVFADNTGARNFYARHGFTPDGTTRTTDQFGLPELRLRRSGTSIGPLAALLVDRLPGGVSPSSTSVPANSTGTGGDETPPAGAVLGTWSPTDGVRTAAAGVRGPDGGPMTTDTVFDLASVTKLFTTAAVLRLTSAGEIDLDAQLDRYLPFGEPVPTVRHLLQHRAGLLPWQPLYLRASDPVAALDLIRSLPRADAPGRTGCYSDLGFILLGAVISSVTGQDLPAALAELITDPLGLAVGYGPRTDAHLATSGLGDRAEQRMVATNEPYRVLLDGTFDHWRHNPMTGVVNDGNAHHALGGVSGHAGLFADIDDLITFGRALTHTDHGLWRAEVLDEFLTPGPDPAQGLGFRLHDLGGGRRQAWHPGFTGCALSVWTGPEPRVVAMATNRLVTEATPTPTARLWEHVLNGLALHPDQLRRERRPTDQQHPGQPPIGPRGEEQ